MPGPVDLHQALRARDMNGVVQLSTMGVDVNVPLRGTTALSLAVCLKLEDAVALLLRKGADVNQISRDHLDRWEPPLYTACRLGQRSTAELLLVHSADVNKKDWYGHLPLWAAALENRIDLIRLLLQHGTRLANIDNSSNCPLYLATKYLRYGRRDVAINLVYSGCDPNHADVDGNTSLYWAMCNEDYELSVLLIRAGGRFDVNWSLPSSITRQGSGFSQLLDEQRSPRSLQCSCRLFIRRRLMGVHSGNVCLQIEKLMLPSRLISYLKLQC